MAAEHTEALPSIAIIAAMTKTLVIGDRGELPWRIPAEIQLFKKLTIGNTVIMGRKTFTSIGKPLPERHNIVISRTLEMIREGHTCRNFSEALTTAARLQRPAFVIGGANVYQLALPVASEMHISWVKGVYEGDTFFPAFNVNNWEVVGSADYTGFLYKRYRRKSSNQRTIQGTVT